MFVGGGREVMDREAFASRKCGFLTSPSDARLSEEEESAADSASLNIGRLGTSLSPVLVSAKNRIEAEISGSANVKQPTPAEAKTPSAGTELDMYPSSNEPNSSSLGRPRSGVTMTSAVGHFSAELRVSVRDVTVTWVCESMVACCWRWGFRLDGDCRTVSWPLT